MTRAHLDLEPQHARSLDELAAPPASGAADGEQTVWFWADTGDGDQPDALSSALHGILAVTGVTAAYVKPPEGPP